MGILKLFKAASTILKGTAVAAVADGAMGTGVVDKAAPLLPSAVATPLQLLNTGGKATRTVVDKGVEVGKGLTNTFNAMGAGGGLLASIGGLVASSLFMPDGIIKSVAEIACFAALLYFGYKMAANAGWLPDSFKNAVEGTLPFLADKPAEPNNDKPRPVLNNAIPAPQ